MAENTQEPEPTLADVISVVEDVYKNQKEFIKAFTEEHVIPPVMIVPKKPAKDNLVFAETRSLIDDVLCKINRETIIAGLLIYETATGHFNQVVGVAKLFLSAGG